MSLYQRIRKVNELIRWCEVFVDVDVDAAVVDALDTLVARWLFDGIGGFARVETVLSLERVWSWDTWWFNFESLINF